MYIIWKIPNINLLQFLFAHESFHVLWRPERCRQGQRASKRGMSLAYCPPWRLRFCPRCSMAQCTWPDKGSSCWSNRTSRWTRIPSWRLSSRRHCNVRIRSIYTGHYWPFMVQGPVPFQFGSFRELNITQRSYQKKKYYIQVSSFSLAYYIHV